MRTWMTEQIGPPLTSVHSEAIGPRDSNHRGETRYGLCAGVAGQRSPSALAEARRATQFPSQSD